MSTNSIGAKTQPNIQPSLQPKPIAISPIRPALPGMKYGQPMVAQEGTVVQHMGQSQYMVGTVAGALPLHMTQPRMASQILQHPATRMTMYVQGQGNMGQIGQSGLSKIVTGVPVYQNTSQFQQGTIRIHQPPVATATAASANKLWAPPQMTLAVQSGQGQVQGLGTSHIRPAQVLQAGQALAGQALVGQALAAGQLAYRPTGPIHSTNFGLSGIHLRNIRPAASITSTSATYQQSIQPKPASGTSPSRIISSPPSISLPSVSTQFVTPLTQIPTPQFFSSAGLGAPGSPAHSTTQFLSPASSTPLSPLVPLSPNMFQVPRTISPTQIFTSSTNLTQIRPTILPFAASCGATLVTPQPQMLAPVSSQQVTEPPQQNVLPCKSPVSDGSDNTSDTPTDLSKKPASPSVESTVSTPDITKIDKHENNSVDMETFKENVLNLRQNKDVGKSKSSDEQMKLKDESADLVGGNSKVVSAGASVETEHTSKDNHGEGKNVVETFSEENRSQGEEEEPEFVWEEYLQEVGAVGVSPTAFKHVEYSLQSGFVKGMKLEVPNKTDSSSYWVATVLMTCGPLLRLRFDGYEDDTAADFWCELATSEIHSIGWCAQNGKNLQPPEEIKDKFSDWREFLMSSLTGARTAPSYLLNKETGCTPIDQIKPGVRLELQDSVNPLEVWLVQVMENVGGRLYLRLEGTLSSAHYFWMFYLNKRLHPIGWAKAENCIFKPPKEIYHEHSPEKWEIFLAEAIKDSAGTTLPVDVFKDQVELKEHRFEVGMKLEALYPGQNMVAPATVCKVINSKYFLIEIDDLRPQEKRESIQLCCHSEYLGIFPVSWCQCKGIRLASPRGWHQSEFVWGEYLNFCSAKAAPEKLFNSGTDEHEFERGMKLEAVNPENPNQICAATITKIVGPLLWIHLDHIKDIPSHIEDIDSHNLFPIGWCESNGYQLKPPRKAFSCKKKQRHFSESLYGEAYRSETYSHVKSGNEGGSWCPEIFFNHRCFSGPFLSKGRISELPKCVGPGPMGLVLKEVLTLLISVAYKSCRVLKELELDCRPNPNMQQQVLKAKYKGKSYRAAVEVCRTEAQVEEFCRNICIKLECCPYLFSTLLVEEICPENCQQLTKTKYNYNYGKKKKRPVGRPPLNAAQKENGVKTTGKRGRKRKRFHLIHKKSHSHSVTAENHVRYHANNRGAYTNGECKDDGSIDDNRSYDGDSYNGSGILTPSKKRKYTHHIPPPSEIQTRGAKLPKYSFERKTHKKILHTQTSPPTKVKPKHSLISQPVLDNADHILLPREESLHLSSNPLHWSISDVVNFVKTTDCVHLARIIKEQAIDGQALLLLNLSTIQEHLDLKLGPAVKLCHEIERLKIAFFENYA